MPDDRPFKQVLQVGYIFCDIAVFFNCIPAAGSSAQSGIDFGIDFIHSRSRFSAILTIVFSEFNELSSVVLTKASPYDFIAPFPIALQNL